MSGFTEVVGRYRQAHDDISVRALAREMPCDPTHMSRLLKGVTRPSPRMARLLDDYFGAGGEIVRAAAADRADDGLDPGSRDRLGYAAARPSAVDDAVVEALAGMLACQRRLEDRIGSAGVLGPVNAQLASIEDMVREAHGPVRPRLVHIAGQWAQFAGWLETNTGNQAAGDARLSQALQLATEAGERNLLAEVLSFTGHAAWISGRPGPLIGLSQAARRDTSAYAGQLAIAASQEAKGHAMLGGNPRDVDQLLDEADEQAERAREHPDDEPPWLYYHSPGFFALQKGRALQYLADDPGYRAKAQEALASGRATLSEGDRNSEWGAEFRLYEADIHARGGEVDEAVAAAIAVVPVARETASPRLTRMLGSLSAALGRRWPDEAGVRELCEALR